jgi:hypothetical protein
MAIQPGINSSNQKMIFKACPFTRALFPVTAHSPGHYFQQPGNTFQGLPIHRAIISNNQEIIFSRFVHSPKHYFQ